MLLTKIAGSSVLICAAQLTTAVNDGGNLLDACRARPWVRAPNFIPGYLLEGDVKVELEGNCSQVLGYKFGLRFKERIFVKLLRNHTAFPPGGPSFSTDSLFEVYQPPGSLPAIRLNQTEWKVYAEAAKNKESWIVHEEERFAFETKLLLSIAEGALPMILVEKFGLLVPNTNYPPVRDHRFWRRAIRQGQEDTTSESMYEYFTEIDFVNGSSKEIRAGTTAFQPAFPQLTTHYEAGRNSMPEVLSLSGNTLMHDREYSFGFLIHRSSHPNRTDTPQRINLHLQSKTDLRFNNVDLGHIRTSPPSWTINYPWKTWASIGGTSSL
ncbi:hypothetical protein BJ138DRAFT_1113618 [Hygrophoropsis aurantiaca]|uniref:Uncharacterized protein n=1 Tax=Hygrophoropsis aurantiaca TaxID=72124 RepID=A0ACB8AD55_9AGAM|nr:hypothetical protein BJ138DRAFT_1113618 [Hygrophoropsis aurantiaca]